MNATQINPAFSFVLGPLGSSAGSFFSAAGLFHAHKVSFSAVAALAGLDFDEFQYRQREQFGAGFILDDQVVAEDLSSIEWPNGEINWDWS